MDKHVTDNRLDALILDLVEWISHAPRPYQDVMDVWRTSCPRLTVWEDAVDRGFLERRRAGSHGVEVVVTERGRHFLAHNNRRLRPAPVAAPVAASVPA